MRQAQAAETEIARGGWRGPLHGVPIGLKDSIDTHAIPTACGSKILKGRCPSRDAHVAERLRHAGAVILGKHAMTEFAFSAYRSEEHTSELQSLMIISYAVFFLKKKH